LTGYVNATISSEQGGDFAGKDVEILADDYASKGDDEMIEVKIDDDVIFVEKKYITLKPDALQSPDKEPELEMIEEDDEDHSFDVDLEADIVDEPETPEEEEEEEHDVPGMSKHEFPSIGDMYVETPTSDMEVLRAKLQKSLSELEDIKSEMSNTFTSTDTIATTIQSVKGMLDALKKDQAELLNRR
jgi:hypothetical protein